MLYDPKWEKKIETKPSLTGFISWLETMDPQGTYNFNDCRGACLVGQYMVFIGVPWGDTPSDPNAGTWKNTNYARVAEQVFGQRTWPELQAQPWTYGAALKRCRATLA